MKTYFNTILLVEDNEDDVFFMKRAIKGASIMNPVQIAEDGQVAIDYLSGAGKYANRALYPLPLLILLDLKLPYKPGLEVLRWLRTQPELESIIVVVLTSSNESSDIDRAYRHGANSYLVKPPTTEDLQELVKRLKLYWLETNEAPLLV